MIDLTNILPIHYTSRKSNELWSCVGLSDSDILFGGSSLLRLPNALSPVLRHLYLVPVPAKAADVELFM